MQTLPIRIGFFKENYGCVKNGERNAYEIKKAPRRREKIRYSPKRAARAAACLSG